MKAESKFAPKAVTIDRRGELADVVLTENVEPFDRDGEGFYRYDEYRVTVPFRATLAQDAERGIADWLAYAKGETTVKETAAANALGINDKLKTAIVDNKAYLAIDAPTVAQNTAQIKRLARQNNLIIRNLLKMFNGID